MYENQYFVAGVLDNPNQIELMDIVTKDKSTRMQNGVPIKTYAHYENTRAHNSATFHAWIWIRRADGIWFWVDPTWTDNLGYVVYGYVENGQEIQCRPDSKYCINNPDHLDKLPLPPTMGNRLPQSPTAYSTDRKEVLKYTGTDWIDEAFNKIFVDVDYSNFDEWATIMASTSVPFSALFDEEESFSIDKIAFGIDLFTSFESTAVGMGLEYLRNYKEENNINGALLNFYLPRRLTNWAAWYAGGGIGLRFDFSEDWASPKSGGNHWYSNLPGTGWFAFKIDTGVLINLSHAFMKLQVSYDNVLGPSFEAGLGWGFEPN